MAVSRINSAESVRTDTSDPYAFNFTPSSTARGIVVAIMHGVSGTSLVSSVTYGGVAMSLVVGASDTATEPGRAELWFLGSGVPTGTQSVSIDLTSGSTTDLHVVVWALDGSGDLEVIDFDSLAQNQANPTVTLQAGGRDKLSIAAMYGGGAAPGGTLATGNTLDHTHDHGSFMSQTCYETTPDASDHTIGWSTLTSDDLAFVAIAVAEQLPEPGHVVLAGGTDSIRTNDANHLDLTGDHEVILCVALDDWSPAAINCLYSKWQADSAAGLAYAFRIHSASSGIINPVWWDTGTSAMRELFGSATGRADGEHLWIKVSFDAVNGSQVAVTVSTSTDPIDTAAGSVSWTQLNNMTESPAAAVSSNAQPLWLGLRSFTNDPMFGKYFYFELKDGIGGTTVARMDARTADPSGSDGFGNSWSFAGNAAWVEPTGGGDETVTPGAVAVVVAVPTPTVTAGATVTPAVVGAAATVPQPSVAAGSTTTPAVVPVVAGVPAPSTASAAAFTPDTVTAVAAVPTPTATGSAVVTPLTVEAVALLPTPTINVAATITVTPSTVDTVVAVPSPTILAAALVSPAVVAASVAVPAPDPTAAAEVTPGIVAVVVGVPSPSTVFGATVTPAVVVVTTSVPTVRIISAAVAILARQLGQFQRLNGRLHLARVRRALRRGFGTDEGWERVSDVFVFDEDATGDGSFDQASAAVAQAWADHQGSDAATLKAAINEALDSYGFRHNDGSRLI